jgi:DNA-binding NarL/FixJ family response regulator
MPEQEGLETIRRLREEYPEAKIMLTLHNTILATSHD